MNGAYLLAAIISLSAALLHGIAGEVTTVRPLIKAGLSEVPKQELRAVWYMITVQLAFSSFVLFLLALTNVFVTPVLVGQLMAVLFLGYSLVWFGIGITRPKGLAKLPQWILLLSIAGLTYWGTI